MDSAMKYIHIMPQGSKIYDYSIIRMFNDDIRFNSNEHLFIVSSEHIYKLCSNYNNVVYESNIFQNKKKINDYFMWAYVVFLHSNTMSIRELITLNSKQKNKIIWCVWGHDLYRKNINKYSDSNKSKLLIKLLYFSIYDRLLKKIKGIGIGFDYDRYEVKERFGDQMKIYKTPYFSMELKMEYMSNEIETKSNQNNLRVMIGHSAYSFLNHKKVLDSISKYKNENILISLVLSYGSISYKEEIIKYAESVFNHKIEIIDKELDINSYLNYLKSVDIAIFDHTHQSALSNIYYLLYLNKKIFLNEKGIIAKALSKEGIDYSRISDIPHMSYHEFGKKGKRITGKEFAKRHIDPEVIKGVWMNTIRELNRELSFDGGYGWGK